MPAVKPLATAQGNSQIKRNGHLDRIVIIYRMEFLLPLSEHCFWLNSRLEINLTNKDTLNLLG